MKATTPTVLSAVAIKGGHVTGPQGEGLGRIEEVMIDLSAGRVAYAVMSFGGFLGIGARMVAIPWEALRASGPSHEYIADVSKGQLEYAPSLRKDQWPRGADRSFLSALYAYYGCAPYWGVEEAQAALWPEGAETAAPTKTEYGALSEVGGFEGEDLTSGLTEGEVSGEAFNTAIWENPADPAMEIADDLNILGSTLRLEGDDFEGEGEH